MSFTLTEQATPRLHRSELAVPGSSPALFEKAAKSKVDVWPDSGHWIMQDSAAEMNAAVMQWIDSV